MFHNPLNRRQFLQRSAMSAAGLLLPAQLPLMACADDDGPSTDKTRFFHFVILADSHVIDEFYDGTESNELDNTSIRLANQRLTTAVDFLTQLDPQPDFYLHCGDLIHTYPFDDFETWFEERNALDIAKEQLDRLGRNYHVTLGNHDYEIRRFSREFTHDLFAQKLGVEPYSYFDFEGWRFIMTNNYLGASYNYGTEDYDTLVGTFGDEQLQWIEALLEDRMPTFIITHHPMGLMGPDEFPDFGFLTLLERYKENIVEVIGGHWHRWVDFGSTYGPHAMAMGSTRYDENSYIIVEVDKVAQTYRFVNQNWGNFTHITPPYTPDPADFFIPQS